MSAAILHVDFGRGEVVPDSALLPAGTVLIYSDMANPGKRFVVTGVMGTYGHEVICEDGHRSHVFASSVGSSGWRDAREERLDAAGIEAWKVTAAAEGARLERERAEAKEKADRAHAEETARLLKEYPKLKRVSESKKSARVVAAGNIRILLRDAFPGVKFSVTSDSYTGGDSIDIKWTDGPNPDDVEKITNRFTAGWFDGMTDCYNYESNAFMDLFGDAKHVMASRTHSREAELLVAAELGIALGFDKWGVWTGFRDRDEEDRFRRELYARDFRTPPAPPVKEPEPVREFMLLGDYVFAA